MTSTGLFYYFSPLSLPLVGGFGFCVACIWGAILKWRKQPDSEVRWMSVIFVSFVFAIVFLSVMVSRLTGTSSPRLVIREDYVSCGSWTHNRELLRVPWRSFTRVSYELSYGGGAWVFRKYDALFWLSSRYLDE